MPSYFFARVADDTLKSSWGDNLRNWWDDDTMMIGVDADHSGGSILVNENIEEAQNGYRIVANSLATNEFGIDYGGILGGATSPRATGEGSRLGAWVPRKSPLQTLPTGQRTSSTPMS